VVLLVYYGGLASGTKSLVDAYNSIILLATFTTLVPYAFCTMAELLLYFQDRPRFSGRRLRGAGPIAAAAFIFSFLTIVGSGGQTALYGFASLLLGLPIYVWMRKADASTPREPSGPMAEPVAESAVALEIATAAAAPPPATVSGTSTNGEGDTGRFG
jgi:amino acid transporter